MKLKLLALLLFCSTFGAFAQNTYRGIYLKNSETKKPVLDVVVLSGDGQNVMDIDPSGFVRLDNMKVRPNSVIITGIGFEGMTIDLSNLKYESGMATVYLNQKITSLAEVEINASAQSGIFKTISDLDIHLRPIVNSQEVLRMVPGLFIGQHAGGGKAEQIFLRGFDIDHGTDIQVSVDGMPVNMVSHAHGQGYADLHFVIPELIEKVNFNKGPYFAEHGNLATAGYVEFKTKNFLDNNFIKVEAGQFNTFRGILGANLIDPANSDQTLFVAGEGSYTRGFFDSPQDFKRFNGMAKYRTKLNENNYLSLTGTGFSSSWDASGQIPDRAVESGEIGFYGAIDNKEGGATSRYNANLELSTRLGNGASLTNQVYYIKYDFELYSNFTFFKNDSLNGDQIKQKESRNIVGLNSKYLHDYALGNVSATSSIGVQVRADMVDNIELSHTKERTELIDPIKKGDIVEVNPAVWTGQTFKLKGGLDITLGARVDYFTNKYVDHLQNDLSLNASSVIVSPKLNFNYKVSDKWQLYLYSGKGFHSNDTRVSVLQDGKDVVTPAWGSDLGTLVKLGDKLVVQTAVWYLYLKQEFVYVGDEGVVEPSGETQRYGYDLSLRYEPFKNLYIDADMNLTKPRALGEPEGENYLPLAPTFTSTGGISYKTQFGWNGSLRYRYMGDRPANEDNSVEAKGYFITDASVNYTAKRWEVGVAIQNLFNTKWKETQFDTESRLQDEPAPVSEIHFTPGTPFFARLNATLFF
ncbi:MAG TPA: TonB-dependent receptor plug domain-containing protein [Saprospiraceae bacterium]|nr:TonB-dependent receptor plug domain-containing protein [Saprospiraceae bacterium]